MPIYIHIKKDILQRIKNEGMEFYKGWLPNLRSDLAVMYYRI
jgi:hypothetical protein